MFCKMLELVYYKKRSTRASKKLLYLFLDFLLGSLKKSKNKLFFLDFLLSSLKKSKNMLFF